MIFYFTFLRICIYFLVVTYGDGIAVSDEKKRILQIVPLLNCGGVERGTIDIARAIIDTGFESFVMSSGGKLVPKLIQYGSAFCQRNVATKNLVMMCLNSRYIESFIKSNGISLVHARSRAPAWSGYYAAKKADVPFITTFHGIYNYRTGLKRAYNSIMTKGERVIAVSNFVRDHIIEHYNVDPSKIDVIYRGVDVDYFSESQITSEKKAKIFDKYCLPKNTPIILMPSRITKWKGHTVLLEALHKIKEKDFFCAMIGDVASHPDYVSQLNDNIIALKMQSRVRIFGPEPDIASVYGVSDVVVSSSIEPEAFGRTVVEAQAMSRLVVATSLGGAGETVVNEATGFHAIPDDANDLAEKIKHCLNILGSENHRQIVTDARASVLEKFSLKQMQDRTIDVYKRLI